MPLRLDQLLLLSTDVELVDELYYSASRPTAAFSFSFLPLFCLVYLPICLFLFSSGFALFSKASNTSLLCSVQDTRFV